MDRIPCTLKPALETIKPRKFSFPTYHMMFGLLKRQRLQPVFRIQEWHVPVVTDNSLHYIDLADLNI